MGAKNSLAAIAITLVQGCSHTEIVNYDVPRTSVADFKVELNEKSNPLDFLRQSLDNIVASEVINPNYLPELAKLKFRTRTHLSPGIVGQYSSWNRSISAKDDVSPDVFRRQYNLETILFHELAHDYWGKISQDRQAVFKEKMKEHLGRYDPIMKRLQEKGLNNLPRPETEEKFLEFLEKNREKLEYLQNEREKVFSEFGTTGFIFNAMDHIARAMPSYQEIYGQHFEELFYGTEAFAFLFELEAGFSTLAVRMGNYSRKNEGNRLEAPSSQREIIAKGLEKEGREKTREKADEVRSKIHYIPDNLKEFFQGILHPRYFASRITN
jgi:hypothetical protein